MVIYGGNGFVGTHLAERLAEEQACTVCLSRSGHKPVHLKNEKWSTQVRWCKGDASQPDEKLLESVDVLVCLVGSPPLPTFSKQSYDEQVFINGESCVNAIQAAGRAGIKRVVLGSAQIPALLNSDRFGYAKGKRLALEAAREFADRSKEHTAVVLQPGAIYGKRNLPSGRVIPLDWFMQPLSVVMPWQFVSVDAVADCMVKAVLDNDPFAGKFTVLSNREIARAAT